MTPIDYLNYYASLLLMQYKNKPKATAIIKATVAGIILPQVSVQNISFSLVAASGNFVLNYNGNNTSSLSWNSSASAIQTALRLLPGLSSVTVSGSIASKLLTVTFTGVAPPAFVLSLSSSSLMDSTPNSIAVTFSTTDIPLVQAIQNAYDPRTAIGAQLDVIGKYVGVSRQGYNFSGPMTLTDTEFQTLIRFAILQNNAGSSLQDIQNAILNSFPGALSVFDHLDMRLSYFFDQSIGSNLLAEFIVKARLLPKPMGVAISTLVYAPANVKFFGFRTAFTPLVNSVGFNNANNDYPGSWISATINGIFE